MKTIVIGLFSLLVAFASPPKQAKDTASISGKITENNSGEAILFATITLQQNGTLVKATESDMDGNFFFPHLKAGTYELEVAYVGYQNKKISNISLKEGQKLKLDVQLDVNSSILEEIIVTEYKVPLIEINNTSQGAIITSDNIKSMPSKNLHDIQATAAGVSKSEASKPSIRGSRSDNTVYFIDGVRVAGNSDPYPGYHPSETIAYEEDNEGYDDIVENKFMDPNAEPLSTFSIDVDRAGYSNIRRFINASQKPPTNAVRIEEMINYFDYNYEQPEGSDPLAMHATYTDCPWNKESKLLHIGLQAKKMDVKNLPPSNIVFLIDVSGSMSAPNKLPLVQASMKLLTEQMRKEDRISIVTYAGQAGIALEPTSGTDKTKIMEVIESLSSGGSTAGAEGILTAYKLAEKHFIKEGNNRVILATDGDFNVGISDNKSLEKLIEEKRNSGIFLSVLGYGMGNYKDNKMQILADKGNGNHAYIDNIQEANKVLVKEFGSTLYTLAKDVKLQIEFNPQYVAAYKLIGYENRLLNKEDFNDDTKDAGEMGIGHTVTAIYEIVPKGSKNNAYNVDDLKYQVNQNSGKLSEELATIKFRYKDPQDSKSKKVEKVVGHTVTSLTSANDDVRFSIAVGQFGMVLRSKADAQTYDNILALAKSAKGSDKDGYRSEFIRLVESSKLLFSDAVAASNE